MLTQEHAALRRIGGSDIAAVMGLSRRRTPLEVWCDLRIRLRHLGLVPFALRADETEPPPLPESDTNESTDRGTYLEPGLRAWASKKLGIEWEHRPNWVITHSWEWATYSPDGLAPKALLEIKSPEGVTAHEWGEQGTDQVPREHLCQGGWGCMVTDRPVCHYAALIGGELRLYRYERDPVFEAALLDGAKAFVENHLLPGIPPPPTYGDKQTVFRLYPRANGELLSWANLNDDQRDTIAGWVEMHEELALIGKAEDARSALVRTIIGDASGIIGLPPALGVERINFNNRAGGLKYKGVVDELAAKFLISDDDIAAIKARHKSDDTRSLTIPPTKTAKK